MVEERGTAESVKVRVLRGWWYNFQGEIEERSTAKSVYKVPGGRWRVKM